MKFRTHISFGIFLFLILGYFGMKHNLTLFILFLVLAILPDIDLHTSKIGRKTRPLSNIVEFIFRHRGFFHSLWIILILYPLMAYFGYQIALVSYAGHIFLDSFTYKGISIFCPFCTIKGHFKSDGFIDNSLFFFLTATDVILFIFLF